MTNKIMALAYDYAASCERRELTGRVRARAALATEVQAHIDYTRAVISERDALKAELKKEEDSHDADVNDLNYHLRNSITNHKQAEDELEALRKVAQLALDSLDTWSARFPADVRNDDKAASDALRKELGE